MTFRSAPKGAWGAIAAGAILAACHGDPSGKPCKTDEACGRGFDCFRDVCVRVCARDDECRKGQTCQRYHCVESNPAPAATERPMPVPDATAAELRAIRRELELVRQNQARLLEAVESLKPKRGKTEPPAAPKSGPKPAPTQP